MLSKPPTIEIGDDFIRVNGREVPSAELVVGAIERRERGKTTLRAFDLQVVESDDRLRQYEIRETDYSRFDALYASLQQVG